MKLALSDISDKLNRGEFVRLSNYGIQFVRDSKITSIEDVRLGYRNGWTSTLTIKSGYNKKTKEFANTYKYILACTGISSSGGTFECINYNIITSSHESYPVTVNFGVRRSGDLYKYLYFEDSRCNCLASSGSVGLNTRSFVYADGNHEIAACVSNIYKIIAGMFILYFDLNWNLLCIGYKQISRIESVLKSYYLNLGFNQVYVTLKADESSHTTSFAYNLLEGKPENIIHMSRKFESFVSEALKIRFCKEKLVGKDSWFRIDF